MIHKKFKKYIFFIAAAGIIISGLWHTGILKLWYYGMSYIANNTNSFTTEYGELVPGEYDLIINLDDLESNIGKELYRDGKNRIYISWIDNTGKASTGGYRIGFRSQGEYSQNGAVLISGTVHTVTNDHSFSSNMSALMAAGYNGKTYSCNVYSTGGINYRDGDSFAFYLFPSDAYENGEVSLQEKGTVHITVTNLYKNVWTKKP